jgi:hypothetical protein
MRALKEYNVCFSGEVILYAEIENQVFLKWEDDAAAASSLELLQFYTLYKITI